MTLSTALFNTGLLEIFLDLARFRLQSFPVFIRKFFFRPTEQSLGDDLLQREKFKLEALFFSMQKER